MYQERRSEYLDDVRLVLAAVVAMGALAVSPVAAADEPTCADGVCPIPGSAGVPTSAPSLIPDGPPRQPVEGMRHPTAPPGPGHDVRPCVSLREFRGAKDGTTKRALEQRWEVVGKGRLRDLIVVGRVWVYPRCGVPTDRGFFAVAYTNGRVAGKVAVTN